MSLGPFWTAERIAEMHRMAEQGLSASQMARALGCSKNAVIGKLHRVKIRLGEKPARKYPSSPYKSGSAPKRSRQELPKLVIEAPPPAVIPGAPCGILDVTGCKWAVGFDEALIGKHVFCNSPKHDERYCEFHVKESVASYSAELIKKTLKRALKANKAAA